MFLNMRRNIYSQIDPISGGTGGCGVRVFFKYLGRQVKKAKKLENDGKKMMINARI